MSELKGILTERETLIGTLSLGADYFKGDRGDSGVYLGDEAPDDEGVNIWIAPDEGTASEVITREDLEEALENIEVDVDLTDYYTKEQVEALIPEVPDVSGFTTMDAVEEKGYQTSAQVQSAITSALSAIGVAEEGAY